MKKSILIVLIAIVAGCAKEHVCECKVEVEGNAPEIWNTPINDTKKKAKERCEAKTEETEGVKFTCNLK